MQSKILKVFYGEDCLPYKDQERTVHFPLLGNAFQGASQTTEIRFYIKDIGGEDLTWVANAKLPNGRIIPKILTVLNDPELEEDYALLQLTSVYTQAKGDLYISLQGYEGDEIEMEYDGYLYQLSGNPTIQATGSIKLTIAYATPLYVGDEVEEITLQEILAYFDTKLNIGSSAYIKCVNIVNIENHVFSTEDGYNAGDIIYNKQGALFGRLQTINSQLRFQKTDIVVDELSIDDGDHRFNFYVEHSQDPILNIEDDESGKELFFDFAEDEIGFTGSPNVKFLKERNIELSEFPTTLTTTQYSIISKQPSYITVLGTIYEFAKEDSFYIYFKKIAVPEKISHTTYYELNGGYISVRKSDRYAELFTDSLNVYNTTQTDALIDELIADVFEMTSSPMILTNIQYNELANNPNKVINYNGGYYILVNEDTDYATYKKVISVSNVSGVNTFISDYITLNKTLKTLTSYSSTHTSYSYDKANDTFYSKTYIDSNLYTQTQVDRLIEGVKANEFVVVDTTEYPTLNDFLTNFDEQEEGHIYLYPVDTTDLTKGYYQYIWEGNSWVSLGTTQIDLSNYYTKSETYSKTEVNNTFVPQTRTIVGSPLSSDISASAIQSALFDITVVEVVERD